MTAASAFAIWLAYATISALIGAACGAGRDRKAAGALLGVLLGPLGWGLALFLPRGRTYYRCRIYRRR